MEQNASSTSASPRLLHYRSHYRVYFVALLTISGLILSFWGHHLSRVSWHELYGEYTSELWLTLGYFVSSAIYYFSWLRYRLNHSIQVYRDHLCIHNLGRSENVPFDEIESIGNVCWSVFYFKMKNGLKYYFSSSLERIDYVWEGVYQARPDLLSVNQYEQFRTKLIQFDHHQKRKEWFFRHKLVDVVNWVILPVVFLFTTYIIQSRDVLIHQQGMYFFRLVMYSSLVLLLTSFFFSIILKKFVFDKKIALQVTQEMGDKLRDIEFEGVILQRSKMMQLATATLALSLIVRADMNLFSLTKIKEDISSFNLKSGHTIVIDNRYNCLACKYPVIDGDLVVFGKGVLGQVMAIEGEMVGQISQDRKGRIIASENIQEVPGGHIAIKLGNQNEIVMIKLEDLIGKIQK